MIEKEKTSRRWPPENEIEHISEECFVENLDNVLDVCEKEDRPFVIESKNGVKTVLLPIKWVEELPEEWLEKSLFSKEKGDAKEHF